ncbi:MAG: T9SS type A sorting domain-containing protein [Bacteroides sp.]|nr:T9SS type A sorting domain-containing protein [Bacteroides sp.]
MGYALREDSVRVYVYDYAGQREHVLFDFSLQVNDVLAMDWVEETDTRKNPVFRVLEVGDTLKATANWQEKLHYLKVYDTVHQVTDMWLSEVGSVSHGIAWRKDFGRSLDTLETVLCTNGGRDYKNPAYASCYISEAEPEYVSSKGKLIYTRTPTLSYPLLDCCFRAIAMKIGELTPILSYNSTWAFDWEPLQVEGVDYAEGDSVEIKGYVSSSYDIGGRLYSEMQLESIRKVGAAPIEKHQKAELILSPNPATETITLTTTGCNLQKVEILDVNGRILYAITLDNQTSFRYNVSWMPSGIYLARVKTPCGMLTEKFSVR